MTLAWRWPVFGVGVGPGASPRGQVAAGFLYAVKPPFSMRSSKVGFTVEPATFGFMR